MTKRNDITIQQKIAQSVLALFARVVLWAHKPHIIGITGSIGKTSTKDAIAYVLRESFSVRQTQKNYNNEIGLPLTILGADAPGKSIGKWLSVLWRFLRSVFTRHYPDILVLEYGVDRPGDMDVLIAIARPQVVVMTSISAVHQEFFDDLNAIREEKAALARAINVRDDGIVGAVLNADDKNVMRIAKSINAPLHTFGIKEDADFFASGIRVQYKDDKLYGLTFKVNYAGKSIPIRLPHVLAKHHAYAILAAMAVGVLHKVNVIDIAKRLEAYVPPVGRMRYLKGQKNTVIIDDTYNASPQATIASLETLAVMTARRKIVVFGDMLELGPLEQEAHQRIIKEIIKKNIDSVILVGKSYHEHRNLLEEAGYVLNKNLFLCNDPESAGRVVADLMKAGDVILAKGSQGMRMEKVVEKIVDKELDQSTMLCRQNHAWKTTPFVKR